MYIFKFSRDPHGSQSTHPKAIEPQKQAAIGVKKSSTTVGTEDSCSMMFMLCPVHLQKFRLGVPIRDMRLLDPNLLTSETGKILVRDNAIVFSVEHVRLIITADFVIIPQTGFERSSLSMRFAAMLEDAIIEASQEKQACSLPFSFLIMLSVA
jgi:hypothetical protein